MADNHIFQTRRLRLRPFEPEDLPALQAYLNHPELAGRRYLPWDFPEELPLSRQQVEGIYEKWRAGKNEFHLGIVLLETGEIIGQAECEWDWDPHAPFLSVVIASARQRLGYGSEVLELLLRHLFENTPAHNVSSWMASWNQPARLFAKRHGFQESGCTRREGLRGGAPYDGILVDLLRPEWIGRVRGGSHGAGR